MPLHTISIKHSILHLLSFDSITLFFNWSLTSVNLLENDIGKEGATAILRACENNNTLQSVLGMAGQTEADFSSKRWGEPEVILMSAELKVNRALKSADFSANSIGDEGTAALSEALKSNSTLEELKLWSNEIGAVGAQSLANMLQFNRALKSVDLRFNSIPDEGCRQLCAAVSNKSITLQLEPQVIYPIINKDID